MALDKIAQLKQMWADTERAYREAREVLVAEKERLRTLNAKILTIELLTGVFKNLRMVALKTTSRNALKLAYEPVLEAGKLGVDYKTKDITATDSLWSAWTKAFINAGVNYDSPSFYAEAAIRVYNGGKSPEEVLDAAIQQLDFDRSNALLRIEMQAARIRAGR
jgi:hypothetical protein